MAGHTRRRREDVPFTWSASCGMWMYGELAGVRFDRMFLEADAIIEAYRRGRPLAEELFGPDVHMSGPLWNGNSYGHVNVLGSELIFPENSEVAHTPIHDSLQQGIAALKIDIDFATSGLMPRQLALWQELKRAFPDEKIGFSSFKAEGPITTAWALRGHDFFTDLIESPDLAKEYLRLVTDSIIKYNRFIQRLNGQPEFSDAPAGLADDVAAMISPALWPEFVMPYLEQYYAGLTSGGRAAHIEDLTVEHLGFPDELRLDSFDPSVSRQLTPALLRDHCAVPFSWRLCGIDVPEMSIADIEQWAYRAAAGGASGLRTVVWKGMSADRLVEKIHAFIRASKEVERLLSEGCSREALLQHGRA